MKSELAGRKDFREQLSKVKKRRIGKRESFGSCEGGALATPHTPKARKRDVGESGEVEQPRSREGREVGVPETRARKKKTQALGVGIQWGAFEGPLRSYSKKKNKESVSVFRIQAY